MNPPGDTLLLRNSPDRRDDRAEPLFATGFCEQVRSRRLRTHEQRFVAGKGTSEGAAAFMNSPG